MTLIQAHKVLITTAVVFFFGFALWEFVRSSRDGDSWGFVRAALYLVVSVGFAVYLCTLTRRPK